MATIYCDSPGCGKSWEAPDGVFPLCINHGCPLRAQRDSQPRRVPRNEQFAFTASSSSVTTLCCEEGGIRNSLAELRGWSDQPFHVYDMKGAKSATSTVRFRDSTRKSFTTSDQMHSEMCAIDYMLRNGYWCVVAGWVMWADNYAAITSGDFWTTEPHCGFCSVFLLAAGLPVGRPTYGNHQLASRLNYQLPRQLMVDPHYLGRVLGSGHYHSYPEIKRMLNAFCAIPADQWVLEFVDGCYADDVSPFCGVRGRTVVKLSDVIATKDAQLFFMIWQEVFRQIMNTNKDGASGF